MFDFAVDYSGTIEKVGLHNLELFWLEWLKVVPKDLRWKVNLSFSVHNVVARRL